MEEKQTVLWNPWHGCHKVSAGCANCYVYRLDARYGRDSSQVKRTRSFDLPVGKNRQGEYIIPSGTIVYTCFSSDFLVEDADVWRAEAWAMMACRSDLTFQFLTKRIDRLQDVLPADWGPKYDHVRVGCTVENQEMARKRMPIFRDAPIRHKTVICEPMLTPIDLSPWMGEWLDGGIVAGGESGEQARPCDYQWFLGLRSQCVLYGIPFYFKQTGARFLRDGKQYRVPRKEQHKQARKAGINWHPQELPQHLPWSTW